MEYELAVKLVKRYRFIKALVRVICGMLWAGGITLIVLTGFWYKGGNGNLNAYAMATIIVATILTIGIYTCLLAEYEEEAFIPYSMMVIYKEAMKVVWEREKEEQRKIDDFRKRLTKLGISHEHYDDDELEDEWDYLENLALIKEIVKEIEEEVGKQQKPRKKAKK